MSSTFKYPEEYNLNTARDISIAEAINKCSHIVRGIKDQIGDLRSHKKLLVEIRNELLKTLNKKETK